MGTKISQMTLTGSAPATSEVAIAYNGENYKINPSNLVSGGGTVNRYTLTSGGFGTMGNVNSLGTGITVPPGVSTVIILGMEASSANNAYIHFPSGDSIPHNIGSYSWATVPYLSLYDGGGSGDGIRVYWGLPAVYGPAAVDNKIYVCVKNVAKCDSITLLFV
tara:strand:+ start:489 stop:977 length:489 start_codon:yes stop_codon:yes gene_type:complete